MTIRTVLLSVQSLLALPEPKDPQDAVVASQCLSNPNLFKVKLFIFFVFFFCYLAYC